jgi:hypothetical protein
MKEEIDLTSYLENVHKSVTAITASDFKYELKQLNDCKDEFFKRCAPCKQGDRVVIVRDLKIPESSGWYSCRHFLILGAKGTVRKVKFFGGSFRVDVVFDNETWINWEGGEVKTDEKHTFCMGEIDIKPIN